MCTWIRILWYLIVSPYPLPTVWRIIKLPGNRRKLFLGLIAPRVRFCWLSVKPSFHPRISSQRLSLIWNATVGWLRIWGPRSNNSTANPAQVRNYFWFSTKSPHTDLFIVLHIKIKQINWINDHFMSKSLMIWLIVGLFLSISSFFPPLPLLLLDGSGW